MDCKGDNVNSVVKTTTDNLNIIIEVQQKWKHIQNCEMEIISSKNRAFVLEIYNHLTDYLTQLDSVQEVNPSLADLKRNLTETISKFHNYISDVLLKRKSLVMQFETPTKNSLLSDINSDCLEASTPHTVFVDPKEIKSDLHDEPEIGGHKDVNGDSTTQHKKKKSLVSKVSKAFKSFVICGSRI
ncbi:uncharacterized protein LOC131033330 [Cryptomeria japonica]|uniref:uncharacterized protein LOC131033330 n=1 Tax=Cryptomeria japonica TaxID=3369 RepID=UPI0025AB926E|nr:uncharacterized protein LOC131033330 [Cryptomeria japonica]